MLEAVRMPPANELPFEVKLSFSYIAAT